MAKRKQPVTGASSIPAPGPSGANSAPVTKRARFSNSNPPKSALKQNNKGKPKGGKKAAVEKPAKVEPTPPAPTRFVVSAGSYERLLYGLSCQFLPSADADARPTLDIQPIFSFPAHLSSLRTVASSKQVSPGTGSERKVGGKYLVSGGADEVIKVWDLRRRKEVGSLEGDTIGASSFSFSLCLPFLLFLLNGRS
jgi:protein MAK11